MHVIMEPATSKPYGDRRRTGRLLRAPRRTALRDRPSAPKQTHAITILLRPLRHLRRRVGVFHHQPGVLDVSGNLSAVVGGDHHHIIAGVVLAVSGLLSSEDRTRVLVRCCAIVRIVVVDLRAFS